MPLWVPVIDECALSVAVTDLLPTVLRVSPAVKVWTPESAAVNV